MVDKTLDQIAYKCDCRNTEEHTKDPGNTAADRDGEDDPQRLQTTKITALSGLIKSRMIALGMAPMNGPK